MVLFFFQDNSVFKKSYFTFFMNHDGGTGNKGSWFKLRSFKILSICFLFLLKMKDQEVKMRKMSIKRAQKVASVL